jgi:heme A synthase
MRLLSTTLILLAELINLLPLSGVGSGHRLQSLYGVVLQDPNLAILMRHRAVLFGVVGGLLVISALHAPLRPAAYAAGFVSMLSFVWIAWLEGGGNPQLRRVVVVDLFSSAALLVAVILDCAVRVGEA